MKRMKRSIGWRGEETGIKRGETEEEREDKREVKWEMETGRIRKEKEA